MRTGDEPVHARSPLRLRLALACFGVLCAVAGAIVFFAIGGVAVGIACVVLALVALTDIGVVIVRMRQGPHYQPGPAVPPYHPVESAHGRSDDERPAG